MFGLLGRHGAGKSTLMRILARLQEPDEGTTRLGELDVIRQKERVRETLGYLPQSFGFHPRVRAERLLDHIWHDLRLWRDANHDGVSQAGELSTLAANGVEWLDVTPRTSGRRDRHGNFFRYRAKAGGSAGRWTYDVFLRGE